MENQPQDDTWISTRHSEGLNCVFFDGHVKWMTRQAAGARRSDDGVFWRMTILDDTP